VVTSALACLTIPSAIVLSLAWLVREPLARLLTDSAGYVPHLGVVLVGILFEVLLIVPLALLRAEKKATRFAVVSVFRFATTLAVSAWLVLGLDLGALGVLLGTATSSLVALVVLVPTLARRWGRLDPGLATGLVRFGLPMVVSALAASLVSTSDLWLLKHYRDLEEVGHYGTANRVSRILQTLVTAPFMLAWPAMMWSVAGKPDAGTTYSRVLTYAVTVVLLAAAAMSLLRTEILAIFAPASFTGLSAILPWLAFGHVPSVAALILHTGAALESRTGLIALSTLGALAVNVGANIVWLPAYGMYAAAVSTLAAYLTMAVLAAIFCRRVHPIPWEWGRVTRATLLVVGGTVIGLQLSSSLGSPASLLVRLAVLGMIVGSLFGPWFLTRRERDRIRGLLSRARRRDRD
jgi:O-antigen/teichoic acid export membrane protein